MQLSLTLFCHRCYPVNAVTVKHRLRVNPLCSFYHNTDENVTIITLLEEIPHTHFLQNQQPTLQCSCPTYLDTAQTLKLQKTTAITVV